jgi:hypothetical protein
MKPELKEGEIYAGAIINPDGTGHHIILLDGDNDDANWESAMAWAASIGGDLPDRIELAMLYKHLPDCFQKEWYWSNTQHSGTSNYAWCQSFDNGYQDFTSKYFKLRARAVRRVEIK